MNRTSFFCGVVVLSGLSYAQEITGSIVGTVQDPTGASIPAAAVTITNTDRGAVVRTAATSQDGNYSAPLLPIGHYSVAVEAKGFRKAVRSAIELNVNDKLTVNFDLEIGDTQQEVTVEASPVQVELQSATSQTLISGTQVRELALNSRNYEQLVTLTPGVVYSGTSDQIYVGNNNPLSGVSNTVAFAMNGLRTSENSWTIDGADNVDRGANLTLLNYPSVDAIAEFRIQRGEYNAESGRDAGGMVNVITRSGTSQFHGDAYEFLRSDKLAANTYFNNMTATPKPALHYNNFGYTLGGPVYIPKHYNTQRNKTFFFFSEEFRRAITYSFVQGTGPTAAEKQGIFTSPVCVDVSSTGTCNSTSTQVTNVNPVAAEYLRDIWSKVPDANASHIINLSLRNISNFRQELYKFDHVFSNKWSISGRFLKDSIPTVEPRGLFTGASLPGVSDTSTNSPGKSVMVRLTGSLSPSLINEVGFSYSYGAILSDPTGLDASVNSPDIKPSLPFSVSLGRIPTLSFASTAVSAVTGYGPYRDYNRNYNWFDNLTKVSGKHTIKTGITIVHYNKSENQAVNNVGSYTFATTPAPAGTSTFQQAWANFLTGNVSMFTQTARDITPDIKLNQVEFYGQDEFRIRPNLTVTVGARWSFLRQPYDASGFLSSFSPAAYDPAKAPQLTAAGNFVPNTGDPLNGFIINGKNSPFGDKVSNENNHDIAPRIGFSWDPFGNGKTAIRSGYGIAYDAIQVSNTYESLVFSNPYSVQTVTINNTKMDALTSNGTVAVATAPSAIYAMTPNFQTPYVQQWSFDIQRELPARTILDIGYFGSKGTHLIGEPDINEVAPGAAVAAGITDANTPITRTTTPRLNPIRPYVGYAQVNAIETWFNSQYNSLQASLQKRFGDNFLNFAYTWSKAMTDAGSDVAAPMNLYNRAADRSFAPFDRTHVFTANWSYVLPWMKTRRDLFGQALGGWQISGIATFNSGLPVAISDSSLGTDPGGIGVFGTNNITVRPDEICDPSAGAPHTLAQWFNTSCFSDVPKGQVRPGNSARYPIRGPGYERWDVSVFKNFPISERVKLQFRGESFNLLNHTNFQAVAATLGTTTGASAFGRITSTRDPRIIQLGMKLYW
ncbi:MAG TPA: carboxypeptidase regulatory-like domain-containing protein [Bryobacteraceae bacterium]|nr:carboxypeptidase regulatory-like domain-containing protein [Bryobacteraceae bacterium]